ncbi:MAG: creatininase family protein [Spirochaetia bacterium]|nr:creatininase family protein [Spirochaetia bacterium]
MKTKLLEQKQIKPEREFRFECLRPGQLLEEQKRCSLVIMPVGPLEYHGPHLPLGTDPINAAQCATGVCRKLGKGVLLPTLFWGTERERPDWMLESLGFDKRDWIVGMDFPTTKWQSHYYPEHIFALVLSQKIEMMISHNYKYICIINGHGAENHIHCIEQLCRYYSNTTDSYVFWEMAFSSDLLESGAIGHADIYETSLMLHYQETAYNNLEMVMLSNLPDIKIPLHYKDFSIVDGKGFSRNPSPENIVATDPRNADARIGNQLYSETVSRISERLEKIMQR